MAASMELFGMLITGLTGLLLDSRGGEGRGEG